MPDRIINVIIHEIDGPSRSIEIDDNIDADAVFNILANALAYHKFKHKYDWVMDKQ